MEGKNLFCHMKKMPSTLPNKNLVFAQATLRSGYKPDCERDLLIGKLAARGICAALAAPSCAPRCGISLLLPTS